MTAVDRLRTIVRDQAYSIADAAFGGFERRHIAQNKQLARIPSLKGRKGGTDTISEWAYTIGLFQAVIHQAVGQREQLDVLDVGCGTGRLSLAAAPLLGEKGSYVGIDVNAGDVAFCRRHYDDPRVSFLHLEHNNRLYARNQGPTFKRYPLADETFDVATALSVWTHLNEADAIFYAKEVARVLRPGGKAVITFFSLDDEYRRFLEAGIDRPSPYSFRDPGRYRFDVPVDGSQDWLCPDWVHAPEAAIGVTPAGLERLQQESGLAVTARHRGQWKNASGLFFQDVLILSKS